MKKFLVLFLSVSFILALVACGNSAAESIASDSPENSTVTSPERDVPVNDVNKDDMDIPESSEPSVPMPSTGDMNEAAQAAPENSEGTQVALTIGDTVIPATLNHTVTAQAFIEQLPFTVTASKMQYDFCGTVEALPYDGAERQAGWKNGDIGYSNGWFALFHSGEDESSGHVNEMIIGHIDDGYLEIIRAVSGSVTITVALTEQNLN